MDSNLVLIDTSVWIETLRKRDPIDLELLVVFDDVVTCLPVVQEVLQGFRDEGAFRQAHDAMLNLPMVESPIEITIFEQAVGLYRTARRSGLTIRSSVDCLIAACAIRNNLLVLHKDRDFAQLATISVLRERSV